MYRLLTMHGITDRWTDRQTDRQHYDANNRSCCVQYDRLIIAAKASMVVAYTNQS